VFEFELVSYGADDSVVKRRFHTCVSKISFLKRAVACESARYWTGIKDQAYIVLSNCLWLTAAASTRHMPRVDLRNTKW